MPDVVASGGEQYIPIWALAAAFISIGYHADAYITNQILSYRCLHCLHIHIHIHIHTFTRYLMNSLASMDPINTSQYSI
jgi:hypothetical protein